MKYAKGPERHKDAKVKTRDPRDGRGGEEVKGKGDETEEEDNKL